MSSASSGCQELVLDLLDDGAEATQLALAGRGEADDVAATIGDVASTLDQLLLLQGVEDADQLAAIQLERVGERCLRLCGCLRRGAPRRCSGTG